MYIKFIRLLSLLALLSCSPAEAASYFLDAVIGNDAYSGQSGIVQNGSSGDGPWKSLARVNSASFLPGDAVYFRCGQRWQGTLTISDSGVAGNPITFGRYGDDCTETNKPVITGAETLDNWNIHSGNIYVTRVNFLVSQVFVDDVAIRLAQYPDPGYHPDDPDNVYLSIDADPGGLYNTSSSIVDSELGLISDQDIVGAGLHLRVNDFSIDDFVVSAFDSATNVLSWSGGPQFLAITDGWGYYLDNKLWMLDGPGEWYFDGSDPLNMMLYVWMPDSAAPGARVQAARGNYGINAQNQSDIVIQGLKIEKTGTGVQLSGASNYVLRNTDITDSYFSGITSNNSSNGLIDSCLISNSVREGIVSGTSVNMTVANNVVLNSGVIGSPKQSGGAISLWDQHSTIKNNRIINAGYHGILFGKNSVVSNNYIENVCLVLNDCSGIYTGNLRVTTAAAASHDSQIHGNTIIGVYGNPDGRKPGLVEALAHGIYIDYRAHGLSVRDNTIVNTDTGMLLHAAYDNSIARNTIYNSRTFALRMYDRGSVLLTGNNIVENTFFSLNSNSVMEIKNRTGTDYSPAVLTINNNHYSSLYTEEPAKQKILSEWKSSGGVVTVTDLDITQWRQAGFDTKATLFDAFSILPFIYQSIGAPNLVTNGAFDADISDWIGYSPANDVVLSLSAGCINPGCLALAPGAESNRGLAVSNNFSLEQDKDYLVSFDMRANLADQKVTVLSRMAGPAAFDVVSGRHDFMTTSTWSNYSFIFTSPADLIVGSDSNGARMDFIAFPGQTIYLDNINVEEVVATNNAPDDDSAILLNPTAFAVDIDCPDLETQPQKCSQYVFFRDATPVVWPVTLPARASRIVVWEGNPYRR